MNPYNITSDATVSLYGAKYPICSFMLNSYYGLRGSGKSTVMQKVCDDFIQQANKSTYDLDKPFLCNGPVNFYIYMSPSIISDQTLKENDSTASGHTRIDIELSDVAMRDLVEFIYKMRDDMYAILELQTEMRKILKSDPVNTLLSKSDIYSNELLRLPEIQVIIKISKQLEAMKVLYPQLKFKETDQMINKNMSRLYKLQGIKWDTMMLSRPKIILNMDDASGTSIFTSFQNNPVFKMITQMRHLSIWCLNLVFHSLGATFSIFKQQMSGFFLFRGLPPAQLATLFETLDIGSPKFQVQDFIDLYHKYSGYYEDDFAKKDKYKYNFLFVEKDPKAVIMLNLDKVLK